ncbi:MAG: alpha/beta hydrolase, partial [Alteromonadaceae bacterium]|nr:alpha/beta hydrolase [Alteromonadaceae bacterium]
AATVDLKPTKSAMFDIGGFSLYLECYENDKPTLILEQGFGRYGSDGVWLENIERLKQDFSVCLYDRAGLGKSESGPVPVTINTVAQRLHLLLDKANIKPPYYFAGGSYAFYVISAFNHLYNDEVLGAVLIDPPPFGYFMTMGSRWPDEFTSDNQELNSYYAFEQSVHDPMFARAPEKIDHITSYQQLKNAQSYGDKPVIVVRAKPNAERYDPPFVPKDIAQQMDTLFGNAEDSFKQLSSKARVVYSGSDNHHLHIADRDLVVKSIKALLRE